MNLVSKEFVAASSDEGVLILSAFAGSSQEMGDGALPVNPHDIEAVADAIFEACMMERIRLHDVRSWVEDFLTAARDVPAPRPYSVVGLDLDPRRSTVMHGRRPEWRRTESSTPLGGSASRPESA